MKKDLGHLPGYGVLDQNNRVNPGAWTITFGPDVLPQGFGTIEMWHAAMTGPGGYFIVYIDDSMFGIGENGNINEYAPVDAMPIRIGQVVSLHFSSDGDPAPQCVIYLRQAEDTML